MRADDDRIVLAEPRGFCAGVLRAVEILDTLSRGEEGPVYALHAIVHNDRVVEGFKRRGVVFVEDLRAVPRGGTVVFSAHGVPPETEEEARALGLRSVDATCPLVKKIHDKAVEYRESGATVVLIGHPEHPEIRGTMGFLGDSGRVVETPADAESLEIPAESADNVAYLTQTTLSPDDVEEVLEVLRRRFPKISTMSRNDICYATLERQRAARDLARMCGMVVVVGSRASSNSNRLREVCVKEGAAAYLVNSAEEIPERVFAWEGRIGVTAGASVPEELVDEVVAALRECGVRG